MNPHLSQALAYFNAGVKLPSSRSSIRLLPESTNPALGTMPDDAGGAPDVAHSGGFLAAAVADVGLSACGALGYAMRLLCRLG